MTDSTDQTTTVDVVLIRHGESGWNTESRFQGQAGPGLTELGFTQARRAALVLEERFADASLAIASDLPRAAETAGEWARLTGRTVEFDERWREIHVGDWAGLLPADVKRDFPEQLAAVERGEDVARGGGETFAELRDRIWGVMEETARELSQQGYTGPALVFTHGGGIRVAGTQTIGMEAVEQRWLNHPANCSVTVFRHWMSEGHQVVRSKMVEYNTSTWSAGNSAEETQQ